MAPVFLYPQITQIPQILEKRFSLLKECNLRNLRIWVLDQSRASHGDYENQHIDGKPDRNPNQVSLSADVSLETNQTKNA